MPISIDCAKALFGRTTEFPELDVENATEWFFSRLYFENLYVGIG
jgi:hypothetical protein